MIEITEKEFENRKDYYCDKAESGTVVLVEKPDGAKILVVPQNPNDLNYCLLYTSPSPRDQRGSRMPSSA